MLIGVPKEIKTHEYRVGLTPASVRELCHHGHDVLVESGAGAGIGFDNAAYEAAGARIADAAAEVFDSAEMIVKVKEPQPIECDMLREGQILLVAEADAAARALTERLMTPLGQAEWLSGEEQMDLVTALAGSGPAFVYRFIDALAEGAAALGLPREQADRLALAMVEGASALAARSPYPPGELARRVASPGGVTQVGLDVLDADRRLARLAEDTLRGARDRSAEMTREARGRG